MEWVENCYIVFLAYKYTHQLNKLVVPFIYLRKSQFRAETKYEVAYLWVYEPVWSVYVYVYVCALRRLAKSERNNNKTEENGIDDGNILLCFWTRYNKCVQTANNAKL